MPGAVITEDPALVRKENAIMFKRRSLLLLSLTVVVANASLAEQTGEYSPLSDGLSWSYTMQLDRPDAPAVQKGKMEVHISGTEEINGESYFKRVTTYRGIPGAETDTDYVRTAQDGIYMITGENLEIGEQLALPIPVDIGDTWSLKILPQLTAKYRVEGFDTVKIFDKVYKDCLKIEYERRGVFPEAPEQGEVVVGRGVVYFCRGVGIVKWIQDNYSGGDISGDKIALSIEISLDTFEGR